MKMLSACLNLLFPRSVSLILIWASFTDIQSSLLVLTKMMQEYYKKPVILLMDEYFGFTGNDVKRLLQSADLEKYGERIQSWYDGYHFGDVDVYCPWDVMNYVRDLQFDPDARPVSYWKNTSSNSIIRSFIDFAGNSITRKLETLMEGGYITEKIEEDLTYDYLHSSEENLWSVLYLTGYLTKVRESELKAFPGENRTALSSPGT